MYERDLKIVRKKAVDEIMKRLTYEADTICHHDELTLCPDSFVRIIRMFNIYPSTFFGRIFSYKPLTDVENPLYDFRKYWENFVEQIILEPDDFQVLLEENK